MNNTIPYKWPFYGKMIKADSAQIALKKNKNDKSSCRSIINNKARKRSGSETDDCYCNVVKVGVNHFLFKIDSQSINPNRLNRTKMHFFLPKSFCYHGYLIDKTRFIEISIHCRNKSQTCTLPGSVGLDWWQSSDRVFLIVLFLLLTSQVTWRELRSQKRGKSAFSVVLA